MLCFEIETSILNQIWVYGNSFESFLVAVVNPNIQAIEHWCKENGVSGDFDSQCQNDKVKEYILGELSKIGKEKKVHLILHLEYFTSC